MSIQNELRELVNASVITEDDALRISTWYQSAKTPPHKRLLIIFGVLGAILVGLGIILVIAHNWDQFPKNLKVVFAFLPLVIGQVLTAYSLLGGNSNQTLKESSAAFLFFAVGASISLVSQVYNIPGNTGDYLLAWMLLCLPVIYVLNSSIASLLFIAGITFYAIHTGNDHSFANPPDWYYWIMLAGIIPHYYRLHNLNPKSNFLFFHNWMIVLSLIICLGTVDTNINALTSLSYICLFSFLSVMGNTPFIRQQKAASNAWKILGPAGSIVLLSLLSFNDYWKWFIWRHAVNFSDVITSQVFYAGVIFALISLYLLGRQNFKNSNAFEWIFIPYYFIFIFSISFPVVGPVFVNILLLALGILTIYNGARKDHLGIVNFGLLIIAILAACRFFDSNISFVLRGIMFIAVGAGFFACNYFMLKKRRTNE